MAWFPGRTLPANKRRSGAPCTDDSSQPPTRPHEQTCMGHCEHVSNHLGSSAPATHRARGEYVRAVSGRSFTCTCLHPRASSHRRILYARVANRSACTHGGLRSTIRLVVPYCAPWARGALTLMLHFYWLPQSTILTSRLAVRIAWLFSFTFLWGKRGRSCIHIRYTIY